MARGGTFLEAPVCGSRVPALEGQLIILTSGDRKLYDDCYSCFEAMGRKSFYLGSEWFSYFLFSLLTYSMNDASDHGIS